MSGQGWDEKNRNISEFKAEGRKAIYLSLEKYRGVKRGEQIMQKSTYKLHTQPPPPE